MKASISFKLAGLLATLAIVPMSIAFGISGFVLLKSSQEATTQSRQIAGKALREALEREAIGLVASTGEQSKDDLVSYDFAGLQDLAEKSSNSPSLVGLEFYSAEGVLLGDGTVGPASRVQKNPGAIVSELTFQTVDDELVASAPVEVSGRAVGFVRARLSLRPSREADAQLAAAVASRSKDGQDKLIWVSLLSILALGGLASGIALLTGKHVTQPILQLRDGTKRIAAGDWDVRIQVKGNDEIADLASGFNAMARDLELAQEALSEQARISREMEIAERIQTSLLPRRTAHEEFAFAGSMEPADEVGGDFYDVLSRPGDELWLTIGDVSSHGLASGLVMLMAQSSFATAWTAQPSASPDAILRHVNSTIYECVHNRMGDNKYITGLVFCHRGGGRFEYAGAHLWPLVYRAHTGEVEQLPVDGAWLGLVRDLPAHNVHEVTLEQGDVLCLYTDGIIETMNAEGEQYDLQRFKESLRRTLNQSPDRLVDATQTLLKDVEEFSSLRDDDRTILLIRRGASEEGDVVTAGGEDAASA